MLNRSRSRYYHTPLTHLADKIVTLELFWPFPLILVGILSVEEPTLVGLALGLSLLPWVARWLVAGELTRPAFIAGPLILLAVTAPVGVWASYDPALSWPLMWTLLGSIALFFAIVNTRVSLRWVARGLVAVAALMAFYFGGQYGHFNYPDEVGTLANLGRLTGSILPNFVFFTPHPNAAAGFLESALLLSFSLAWRSAKGERVAWIAAAILIAYGVLISGSRGAWVGLVIAVGLWALLLIPQRGVRLAVGGVTLAGVAVGLYFLAQAALIGATPSFLSSTVATANSRFIVYRNSLYLLGDYPFSGIGLGDTFGLVYSRYQLLIPVSFLTYSHNLFLSVGLGLGGLGLLALVWLLISFYTFVIRAETIGLTERASLRFRAAWLGATVTFIHGLTDAPQFAGSGWTMPMLFGIVGLAVAVGSLAFAEAKQDRAAPSTYRRAGWILGTIVGLALLVAAIILWRPLLGSWYANLGAVRQTRAELAPNRDEALREAELETAVTDFARALNVHQVQPVANRRLGVMALDRENFETAAVYLDQAYRQEPNNQATLKALGYVYMWAGQPDLAEPLLQQLDDQAELVEELGNWSTWWAGQNRPDLAEYATEMARRLAVKP